MSAEQTINGICMHCNILLNDNKSIPQTVFTNNNNKMRTVFGFVENKYNPIHGRPCVHPGTKFKSSHCIYFVEINQQIDSFPLLTQL